MGRYLPTRAGGCCLPREGIHPLRDKTVHLLGILYALAFLLDSRSISSVIWLASHALGVIIK